jgi:hypothetical protein
VTQMSLTPTLHGNGGHYDRLLGKVCWHTVIISLCEIVPI